MACEHLTKDKIEEFKKTFQHYDKDGSGTIDPAEFTALVHSLGDKHSDSEIQGIIKKIDIDGSGHLDFTEFLTYMAFRTYDKDNSGTITPDELKHAMHDMGKNLPDAEVNAMIKKADHNGDGHIDLHEFVLMMKS
jgi:calmodulin